MATAVDHVWKPSDSRTLVIDSFVPVPRGTTALAPALLNWPAKDPNDVLDYQVDIAPALIGNEGDAILGVDASVSPSEAGGLRVDSVLADGSCAVLWMSGGRPGGVYTITLSITTANGRAIQRSVLLPVIALSTPVAEGGSILLDSGLSLTDENGNPVLAVP